MCVQKLTFFNSWCLQNGVYIIIIIMSTWPREEEYTVDVITTKINIIFDLCVYRS